MIPKPRRLQPASHPFARELNAQMDNIAQMTNLQTEWPIEIQNTPTGPLLRWAKMDPIWAKILDGTNPYSWCERLVGEDGDWNEGALSGTTTVNPAYEINDCKTVVPGTVVLLWPTFPQASADGQEFSFDIQESPMPAKITGTTGASASTLNGAITSSDVSLTITSAADFPGRNDFYIKIEDEILRVTAGAGTTTWTVTRAQDDTDAATHADTTAVTLAAAYAWTEQKEDDNGFWANATVNQRTGTAISQPAYERNNYTGVETNTQVLLWRRYEKLAGASTLSADVDNSTTTIPMTSRTSFPATGDFCILCEAEIMLVTSGNGSGAGNFTATRGFYGTKAEAHSSTDAVVEVLADWVFDQSAGAAGGKTKLTVREVDLSPSISNVNIIEFDQDDGFVVTNPSARRARIDLPINVDRGTVAYDSGTQTITAGDTDALLANSEVYDTNTYHDTSSNKSRITFAGGIGRYIATYSLNVEVTFAGADVQPERFDLVGKLNGSTEVVGSRNCCAFWRITAIPNSTATAATSIEMDHHCLTGAFMVNVTNTGDYLEMFGDTTDLSLDSVVSDFALSVHKLNRAGSPNLTA